jgi:putative two-component system response regulator
MDGSGYPDGLRGEQIPLTVRLVQIVDICDALTTDRPYRRGLPVPQALTILDAEAERGWLDKGLVCQFASLVLGPKNSVGHAQGRLDSSQKQSALKVIHAA